MTPPDQTLETRDTRRGQQALTVWVFFLVGVLFGAGVMLGVGTWGRILMERDFAADARDEMARVREFEVTLADYFDDSLPIDYLYCPSRFSLEGIWRREVGGGGDEPRRLTLRPGEERYDGLLAMLGAQAIRPVGDSVFPDALAGEAVDVPKRALSVLRQERGGATVRVCIYYPEFVLVEDAEGQLSRGVVPALHKALRMLRPVPAAEVGREGEP